MQFPDKTRILIADDHKAFGMMIAAIVRAALTQNVAVVQTVEAAIDDLEATRADFLITDLRFGTAMGGLDLIKLVRGHKLFDLQTLPILVLSANADMPTVKRAQAMGVNDFLGKPISPTLLLQRLTMMEQLRTRVLELPNLEATLDA